MSEFDDAVSLEFADDPAVGRGAFDDGWLIGNAINGGILMATGLTALRSLLRGDAATADHPGHPDPVAISAYFMTPATPGPFWTESEPMRSGRRLRTGQVSIFQHDGDGAPTERMRAMASFGDLAGVEPLRQSAPPDMPPPEDCVSSSEHRPEFLRHSNFLDRVDLRLDPTTAGWAAGRPSMRGELRGWLRLADGREPDTTMLALALDALPPVAFDLGLFGWTPTLEFSGHIRRRPVAGWLQVALSTENVGGGMLEEDALIWDSAGFLVAQSRQLCGVREGTLPA